jgi:hypothetical protein
MGQVVADDGLLVLENYQKPGFVSVWGESFTKPKDMTCQEAEIYTKNHICGKFRLEKTDQMPLKQSIVEKNTCRRCSSPLNFHCSACRTKYCSRSCQKKDWRRHIFTCTINNRPNDVDYENRPSQYRFPPSHCRESLGHSTSKYHSTLTGFRPYTKWKITYKWFFLLRKSLRTFAMRIWVSSLLHFKMRVKRAKVKGSTQSHICSR